MPDVPTSTISIAFDSEKFRFPVPTDTFTGFDGAGCVEVPGISVGTATGALRQVTVAIEDGTPVLTGDSLAPENWIIAGGSVQVLVSDVEVDGTNIVLTTSEQEQSVSYTLTIPQGVVKAVSAYPCLGPFSVQFTGVDDVVDVLQVRSVDARMLEVIFSTVVNEGDALNPANYAASGGLSITAVQKVSPVIYRLTTSKQSFEAAYTLTVSNIRDA